MANISSSVTASCTGGAAIVTTAGGPGATPPVTIAAFQNADVLIVAVPHGLAGGGGSAGVPPRRPARPQAPAGWAQPTICTVVGKTKKTSQTGASSAAKKTTTSTSSASKSTSTSTAKSSDPLAFLSDSKMSVEEKLFRFLAWVAGKNEKDLLKKMDEICAKQKQESSSSKKGLLGSIASGVGGALGLGGKGPIGGLLGPVFSAAGIGGDLLRSTGLGDLVSQLSGPVLAAGASMLGFPMLAPALMKAGPALAQGAMGLLGASGGDEEPGTSSTSRDKEGSISQMDAMELEWLQEKQKQMFGLISNVMKAIHDTKMAVINNIRA